MTNKLRILGVDPSLSNFGMVIAHADLNGTKPQIKVKSISLIRTNSGKPDLKRAQEIAKGFYTQVRSADVIIAELPQGAQSARAAWSLGIVLGILSCCKKPLVTVTPFQAKQVTGNKKAKKDAMLSWAIRSFPETPWYTDNAGIPYKYNHHIADALAVITAGLTYKRKEILNGTTLS